MSNVTKYDNQGALRDNLERQIAYLQMATHIQEQLEKLKQAEQSLRETIGVVDES